ncbi:hypothetical protein D9613_001820 [Agrocybe pediades]|uniref:RlpA-like protein double-psi beta-barrel domain-containing protein n=1 Tax=Agrocybe pediades TaxID=84607 RepID=A0A8H4R5G8_9AGAR|nr:hypothetical protein D9613_001820 [Agrocybe pediades]
MRSFTPFLSLLSSFLLLHPYHLFSLDPAAASLTFANAAGLETKNTLSTFVNLKNGSDTLTQMKAQDGDAASTSSNLAEEQRIVPGSQHANRLRRRHGSLSRTFSTSGEESAKLLSLRPGRRAANAQFTNYVTGLGACGTVNVPSDFVVALNAEQWDNGAHCYAPITITIKGKTLHATIVDRCEKCGYNNLDFTDGLFSNWGDPIIDGVLQGEWEYGSGAAPPPKTTAPPPPKPTSTKITSTFVKPTPTSSKIPASSTSIHSSSTSISTGKSASTKASSSTASSSSASATPNSPSDAIQNLELLFSANVGIGGVLMGSLS